MCGFHHRNASLVNFALLRRLPSMPRYAGLRTPTAEVICDLAHVGAPALQLMVQSRDPSEVCGITDNVMDGAPGKTGAYCGRVMEISPCGTHVVIQGTSTLAGSSASLLDMFGNMTRLLGVPEAKAAQMLSQTPAEIANIEGVGKVCAGGFAGEEGAVPYPHSLQSPGLATARLPMRFHPPPPILAHSCLVANGTSRARRPPAVLGTGHGPCAGDDRCSRRRRLRPLAATAVAGAPAP